jgi:hypothetical protein
MRGYWGFRRRKKDRVMPQEKELGKISKAEFGMVYDREFLFGLLLTFEGKGWGVSDHYLVNIHPDCKWPSETEKLEAMAEVLQKTHKLLQDAKAYTVSQLIGKPVEITFENRVIKGFRILAEVL